MRSHPDPAACYCPTCAEAILDSLDPLKDHGLYGIITEARVEAEPDDA